MQGMRKLIIYDRIYISMITENSLRTLYIEEKLSMMEISAILKCSHNQVVYWMHKYEIDRRSISDAIYQQQNPNGDPFKIKHIGTIQDAELLGMGLGLYWGEGTKRNKSSIRLGNTDAGIIKTFIEFLTEICGIDTNKLRYSLQIFSDVIPQDALNYWMKELNVDKLKFTKVIITPARSIGTYRNKNMNGVLTVNFHNRKLRDIIVGMCRDSSVGRAQQW